MRFFSFPLKIGSKVYVALGSVLLLSVLSLVIVNAFLIEIDKRLNAVIQIHAPLRTIAFE